MDSTRNYYSVILIYTSHALTKGGIAYNFEITERARKKNFRAETEQTEHIQRNCSSKNSIAQNTDNIKIVSYNFIAVATFHCLCRIGIF